MSKRAKNSWKKPQITLIACFSKKNLSWQIRYISIAIICGKKVWCHYKFWTYFFSLCEKEVSFSNLLTRANHTRPCFFLLIFIKLYWGQSAKRLLAVVRLPFYVVQIQKNWPKIVTFSARNVLDQLLTLNMHLIITIDLL